MTTALNPKKNKLFNIACLVAVAGNLFFAFLNYVLWSEGLAAEAMYEAIVASDAGLFAAAAIAVFFGLIATVVAYIASLDPHRARRPSFRIYLLFLSFFALIAGQWLGAAAVHYTNLPAMLPAAVVVCLLPLGVLLLERFVGKRLIALAKRAFRPGRGGSSLLLARLGLSFFPASREGESIYALSLAGAKRHRQALPYLEDHYERGDRSQVLLTALADAYEITDKPKAANVVEEIQSQSPSNQNFKRLVRLWRETGQTEKLTEALFALSPGERREWNDLLTELVFESQQADQIRTLCEGFAAEEGESVRVRQCYERLLNLFPDDTPTLKALAQIYRDAREESRAAEFLEKLLQHEPENSEYRRWLIEYYRSAWERPRTEDVIRHLEALLAAGEATTDEKLEILKHAFELGDSERIPGLFLENAELQSIPETRLYYATVLFERQKMSEALDQISKARELHPSPELEKNLVALESKIKAQLLTRELKDLGEKVQANPQDLDLRFSYLDRLLAVGKPDRVVVSLEEILNEDPDLRDRVVSEIEKMLARHGRNFPLLSYLSDIYLREKNWDKVHALHLEMARESLHPEAIMNEGALKILREFPDHRPSLLTVARHSFHTGRLEDALDHIGRYYRLGGERSEQLSEMEFDAALKLGHNDRAIAVGEELIKERADDAALLLKVADVYAQTHRYDRALELLRQAKEADPENPSIRPLIKQSEERRKRLRVDQIKSLLADNPKDGALHEELGDLYHDFGQLNDAIVEYQRAAQDKEHQNVSRAKLAYVLARKSMHGEAEEALHEMELKVDQQPEEQDKIKALLFRTAELMEDDRQEERALQLYKRIFRVDAGYRNIVERIEMLQRPGRKRK